MGLNTKEYGLMLGCTVHIEYWMMDYKKVKTKDQEMCMCVMYIGLQSHVSR
jgi:hypothetical protein